MLKCIRWPSGSPTFISRTLQSMVVGGWRISAPRSRNSAWSASTSSTQTLIQVPGLPCPSWQNMTSTPSRCTPPKVAGSPQVKVVSKPSRSR